MVRALIAAGADVNIADHEGSTPIQAASAGGHTDIVYDLIAAGANVNTVGGILRRAPIYNASRFGRTDMVRALIAAGAHVNITDYAGSTPTSRPPALVAILTSYTISLQLAQALAKQTWQKRKDFLELVWAKESVLVGK